MTMIIHDDVANNIIMNSSCERPFRLSRDKDGLHDFVIIQGFIEKTIPKIKNFSSTKLIFSDFSIVIGSDFYTAPHNQECCKQEIYHL